MISNYVKTHLVTNPVKNQYDREQIAYLIFIAVVKGVLSLDNAGKLMALQKAHYDSATAYNYFCDALEQALRCVFGFEEEAPGLEPNASDGKVLLRNVVVAVAHKTYLDKCLGALDPDEAADENE